jgi:hypothetical protein
MADAKTAANGSSGAARKAASGQSRGTRKGSIMLPLGATGLAGLAGVAGGIVFDRWNHSDSRVATLRRFLLRQARSTTNPVGKSLQGMNKARRKLGR